jgi:hypothetical protein
MFLDYFALGLVIFVTLFIFYAIIGIHDIPYEISVKRNHPHQDAIHVTGWVSMFTLHAIWPFLWIWATLYREDRGWGFGSAASHGGSGELERQVAQLAERLDALQTQVDGTRKPQEN